VRKRRLPHPLPTRAPALVQLGDESCVSAWEVAVLALCVTLARRGPLLYFMCQNSPIAVRKPSGPTRGASRSRPTTA
jgi:hypothetical protein